MLSASLLYLIALAVGVANASPHALPVSINETTGFVSKRANPAPVSCGPADNQRAWPLQSVEDAYNALVADGNTPRPNRPQAGTRYYPRWYGERTPTDAEVVAALDAIPECVTGRSDQRYFEFPITEPVFAGGPAMSQGPDRVVAISADVGPGGVRTFTYCLAMTHRGAATSAAFLPCTNAP